MTEPTKSTPRPLAGAPTFPLSTRSSGDGEPERPENNLMLWDASWTMSGRIQPLTGLSHPISCRYVEVKARHCSYIIFGVPISSNRSCTLFTCGG